MPEDMQDTETGELRWSAYTRTSTGLIYMGARYYEPETGRFTQIDPVPYGVEIAWGQNNRWVYCANDPVNLTDPTGELIPLLVVIGFIFLVAAILFLALMFSVLSCYFAAKSAGNTSLANDIADFMLLMGAGAALCGAIGSILTALGPSGALVAATQLWGGGFTLSAGGASAPIWAVIVLSGACGAYFGGLGYMMVDAIYDSIYSP